MWPYWLIFLLPAVVAAAETPQSNRLSGRRIDFPITWGVVIAVLVMFIGYRVEVGGDWFTYLGNLDAVAHISLQEVLTFADPGYYLLSWISVQLGWGIIGVNVMGAVIFVLGLGFFCRSLARPWLALTVAIPYMVIVVAMGYTRQGIALALAMMGLAALARGSVLRFIVWVVLGATFHKTAVLLVPVGALAQTDRRAWQVIWVLAASVLAYLLLLADSTEMMYANYVEAQYASDGAFIRLLMNLFPGILLLLFYKRFRRTAGFSPVWLWFALLSVALIVVLELTDASTAVDRVGLYLLPFQLMVFSALPDAFADRGPSQFWAGLILFYYAAVQFVFFNFATHSEYWLPYRFFPLEQILT